MEKTDVLNSILDAVKKDHNLYLSDTDSTICRARSIFEVFPPYAGGATIGQMIEITLDNEQKYLVRIEVERTEPR